MAIEVERDITHQADYTRAVISATTRQEAKQTWDLAFPVVLTQLSVMAMGLVDTVMVGVLGEVPLASVALGNSIFNAVVMSFAGILMTLDAIVGQLFGAGKPKQCGQTLWQGYWIALAFGLPLTILFLDAGWMGTVMEQPPAVAKGAAEYLYGRSFSILTVFIFAAQRGFMAGVGNTRTVLYIALWANVANALADYILIYGSFGFPKLGVEGCGFATSCAQGVMALAGAFVVHMGGYRRDYAVSFVGPIAKSIRGILALGLPFAFHLFVEIGAFAAAAVMAGWIGETPLAAHQVALTLATTTFMVPVGLSSAASIRVAHCVGQHNIDRAALAGRISLGLGATGGVLFGTIFLVIPETLARFFIDDPNVIHTAASLLRIAGLFQLSDALQVVAAGCLRGTGETNVAFFANLVGHWFVGLPVGYLLAFWYGYGVDGVWMGMTLGLTIPAIVLTFRFVMGGWRRRVEKNLTQA